jgi:hypothetical protein
VPLTVGVPVVDIDDIDRIAEILVGHSAPVHEVLARLELGEWRN